MSAAPGSRTAAERARDVRRLLDAARRVHADRARLAESIARSTGLSPEGVALGFESLELDAAPADLASLVAGAGDAAHVHVILSANVFIAPLRAVAIARAAADRVTVRPSSRDPVLARALVAAASDPAIVLTEARDVAGIGADRIDVYGRDETIARVRSGAGAGVTVRGHGAGLGVAFIRASASGIEAAAAALAADVVPFDQRGCLSPRVALVVAPTPGALAVPEGAAFALAAALDRRLAAWGVRVPRGELAPEERAEWLRWRDTCAFAGRLWQGAAHAVALAPRDAALAIPPPGRHVLVVPVGSLAEARERIAAIAPFVVTVGSNDPACLDAIRPAHARPAPLGSMQRPALDGPVDQRSL